MTTRRAGCYLRLVLNASADVELFNQLVLLEAGLPFTAIKIDEHTKVIEGGGDYRKVSPLGYVPSLVLDDGTLLTEGPAIVQYIPDKVPVMRLAPPNGTVERTKLQA
jgi:glutathione S-transferase